MITRRQFVKSVATSFVSANAAVAQSLAHSADLSSPGCRQGGATGTQDIAGADSVIHPDHLKTIPSSQENISSIGMGTWITFDVADNGQAWSKRSEVLQEFFKQGGQMVDSSPMYGYAEEVIGYCLERSQSHCNLFSASKLWTPLAAEGRAQMSRTESLWGVKPMDLMYVHNLLNWEKHLPQLRDWKAEGRIRYLGITTSHGRRHTELESLLKSQTIDFVQFTYNYDQRIAEERLIPMARDNGVAVIVNRPFQRGHLVSKYQDTPLPGIATELGCQSWAQYLLLFVVSHPDVTVAIPATSRQDHMVENMTVMQLPLPDKTIRRQL